MRTAIAVYDCTADDDGELSFKKGDTIADVVESNEDGWYHGRLEGTSSRGLFPYNYVKLLDETQILPPPAHTSSKAIPPKLHHNAETNIQFGASVSPPNSTLSSTWSFVSTKDDDDDSRQPAQSHPSSDRRMSTAADAFEKAMIPKPHSLKGSNSNNNNKPSCAIPAVPAHESPAKEKPSVAPKPTQLKKTVTPSTVVASRVRSYSTPATHLLTSDGSTQPLDSFKSLNVINSNTPVIRPKPISTRSSALATTSKTAPRSGRAGSVSTKDQRVIFDNDVIEDDEGYQVLVTPSILRQRQRQRQRQASAIGFPKSPPSSIKGIQPTPSASAPRLVNLPAAKNPAPRLPSRPGASPSRRPRASKSSSSSSGTPSPMVSPHPNPKPTQPASDALSTRGSKARSVSNPPPIHPKPPTLATSRPEAPPPVNSKRDTVRKVPPPPVQQPSPHTPALPARPVAARREQFEQQQQQQQQQQQTAAGDDDGLNRTLPKSNDRKASTVPPLPARTASIRQVTEPVKKAPPPPPPSRPIPAGTNRYEELFNAIHDDGVVDGQTAKIIWRRSRVPDNMLARIWQHCDPQGGGLLNKQSFIQGMREIDAILVQKSGAA